MEFDLHIPKISCAGCANAVTKAITREDETAQVRVDILTKHVKVQTTIEEAKLKAILVQAGYPPV